MKTKTKYEVKTNIEGFSGVRFDTKKEAENHILDDLQFIKDKPQYSHLKHKINQIEVEANAKNEIFRYFLDY